jgi:glycerophosphoryl diester phosphodiesterase
MPRGRAKLRRILLIAVAGLAAGYLFFTLLASRAPDHPYFTAGPPPPLVIAHQGGDGLWPSNTRYAFERAAAMGVDVLELDIHATADGVLVAMHDETVDRTTNGTGAIKALNWADIRALDAGYHWSPDGGQSYPYRGRDITVPSLEEVFQAFPDYALNIEIKQAEPSIAAPFCDLIHEYDMAGRVLVPSFSQAALDEFQQTCPELATAGSEQDVRALFFLSKALSAGLISPDYQAVQVPEQSGGLTVLTPGFIRAAHGRNVQVHAWTINEAADMVRLLELGVDGIITDYPDRLLALLGRPAPVAP